VEGSEKDLYEPDLPATLYAEIRSWVTELEDTAPGRLGGAGLE